MRVNDAERDAAVEVLRSHATAGSLTLDEFADRVGAALASRTRDDLDALTADLPAPLPPVLVGTRRQRAGRWLVAVFGGSERRGRWRPGERTTAVALFGGCTVDLRAAEIDGDEVLIGAVAVFGAVDVVVPEGIDVDLDGLAIFGGKECRLADAATLPGGPVVRVRAYALFGGVTVRTKEQRDRRHERHRARHQRHERRALERAARRDRSPEVLLADVRAPAFDGTVTILFSDIQDFTGMTERLGDLAAQGVLRAHYDLVRRQLAAHGGHEVKCQGDSFMVAFDGARRALRCALAIQRSLDEYADEHPDEPIRVRMGVHTGEAIREDDDLFGTTVIVAARIADQAGGGEVLVSSLVRELTESSGEFRYGPERQAVLKGFSAPQRLHALER